MISDIVLQELVRRDSTVTLPDKSWARLLITLSAVQATASALTDKGHISSRTWIKIQHQAPHYDVGYSLHSYIRLMLARLISLDTKDSNSVEEQVFRIMDAGGSEDEQIDSTREYLANLLQDFVTSGLLKENDVRTILGVIAWGH